MKQNITLAKIILPLTQTWFWLGVWLPYYLLFTDYAGVGIIESVVISTMFILEIPTGAFADLLGKKKTIILSLLVGFMGDMVMALSQSSFHLMLSVFIMGIAGAFMSGTSDALIYDSLKQIKEEKGFDKILAQIGKYSLISMAAASFIGGFLYELNFRIPFFLTAGARFLALLLSCKLIEPYIDTEKFSLRVYLRQTRQGFLQLFKHKDSLNWILKLLLLSSFAVILIEVLDPALAIDYGFSEKGLGILYAVIPLISAAGNHFYPKFKKNFRNRILWIYILSTFLISVVFSPIYGLLFGAGTLFFRNFFYPFIDIIISKSINKRVESKYRATTLSTFSMMKNLPYVLFAYFVGRSIDESSAVSVGTRLSLVYIILATLIYAFFFLSSRLKHFR